MEVVSTRERDIAHGLYRAVTANMKLDKREATKTVEFGEGEIRGLCTVGYRFEPEVFLDWLLLKWRTYG